MTTQLFFKEPGEKEYTVISTCLFSFEKTMLSFVDDNMPVGTVVTVEHELITYRITKKA